MRYELAVGETGARRGIPHQSAHHRPSPLIADRRHFLNVQPFAYRVSRHEGDCLLNPSRLYREGTQVTSHHPLITEFLIDTLPIRNASNSFPISKRRHSNRHSSEPHLGPSDSPSTRHQATEIPKLSGKQAARRLNFKSSTSSLSYLSSSSAPNFTIQTTRPEVLHLHSILLCYSFLVTRVPPNGLRASAPARSHGCGVDVSLPRNVHSTGAFPHKFDYSTGLIGSMGLFALTEIELRDLRNREKGRPSSWFGFRSPESPVGQAVV
jgi:hypothetical protein